MFTLNEEWRDSNWYNEAGASMQKKANYLKLGIYQINQMMEDPTKNWPPHAIKDMKSEKNTMQRALDSIYSAYENRCRDLKTHPELLKSFQEGFLGS